MKKNKSAIKRAKQSEAKRLRNSHVKSTMKSQVKKALASIAEKGDSMEEAVKTAISRIDKAASKGVIHRNTASRKVARLSKKLNAAATKA